MKKILIALSVLIVIGVAYWAFATFGVRPAPSTVNNSVTLPVSDSVPNTSADSSTQGQLAFSLTGVDGSTINTLDFIHASTTGAYSGSGYLYLGYHTPNQGVTDQTATDDPPYLIAYIMTTQYFNISILHEPIGGVRAQAEQYLLSQLGVTQDQMCRINYMVSVPDRVNSQFAGKNLGFSFCIGATPLPQ